MIFFLHWTDEKTVSFENIFPCMEFWKKNRFLMIIVAVLTVLCKYQALCHSKERGNISYMQQKTKTFLTFRTSRWNSPYSRRVPRPLVKIPQPLMITVPDRRLDIVAGRSMLSGLWVVTPISKEPVHFWMRRSIRSSKNSPVWRKRDEKRGLWQN